MSGGLSVTGPSLLEGWHSTELLLQQSVRPLALELEWWHGEEGEQPCQGCGRPMPLYLQVYCAGAWKSAVFSPLHMGDCW